MRKFSMILFAIGMMASGLAFGQDRLAKINVSGYFDSASKYVSRGLPIINTAVYQTAIDVTIMNVGPGHIGIGWWGNYTLNDAVSPIGEGTRLPTAKTPGWEKNEYTEYRWKAGYAMLLPGDSMLELGVIEYIYPHDGTADTDTTEMYAKFKARLNIPGEAVEAYFTMHAYYDTDEAEGWYLTPGLMAEMKVANNWKAFTNVNIGWGNDDYNQYYFGKKEDGLNDVTVEAGIGAPLDKNVSLKIGVGFSKMLDSDIARVLDNRSNMSSGNAWFKIGIHAKF